MAAPISVLGPGRRAAVWVQGCNLACVGCASVDTWDPMDGFERSPGQVLADLTRLIEDFDLTGLTVTGGEPFQQPDAVAEVIEGIRAHDNSVDVLVFTGYAESAARRRSPKLFAAADAVIAGRYEQDLPATNKLLATSNQALVINNEKVRPEFDAWLQDGDTTRLQISVNEDEMFLVGLPAPGDLDRLRQSLAQRGVELEGVSWQP
jgi:anaerobic ribonucleoside-triphosphate reductase activating protein